jgi:hypothetical protein
MAQSREQLTIDNTKDNSSSMFKRPRGCYLSQAKAFGLLLLVAGAVVAAVVLTYHWGHGCGPFALSGDNGSSGTTPTKEKVKDVRLPTNVKPLYYKVDLIPFIEEARNFTIDGKVSMICKCKPYFSIFFLFPSGLN